MEEYFRVITWNIEFRLDQTLKYENLTKIFSCVQGLKN